MLLHFTVSDKRRKHPLSNTKIKEKRSFFQFRAFKRDTMPVRYVICILIKSERLGENEEYH